MPPPPPLLLLLRRQLGVRDREQYDWDRERYPHHLGHLADRGPARGGPPDVLYEIEQLRTAFINIYDTACRRFEARKKRDVELAYQKMTPEEKAALQLRQKMTEIDAADTDDDECAQPSPTPV